MQRIKYILLGAVVQISQIDTVMEMNYESAMISTIKHKDINYNLKSKKAGIIYYTSNLTAILIFNVVLYWFYS